MISRNLTLVVFLSIMVVVFLELPSSISNKYEIWPQSNDAKNLYYVTAENITLFHQLLKYSQKQLKKNNIDESCVSKITIDVDSQEIIIGYNPNLKETNANSKFQIEYGLVELNIGFDQSSSNRRTEGEEDIEFQDIRNNLIENAIFSIYGIQLNHYKGRLECPDFLNLAKNLKIEIPFITDKGQFIEVQYESIKYRDNNLQISLVIPKNNDMIIHCKNFDNKETINYFKIDVRYKNRVSVFNMEKFSSGDILEGLLMFPGVSYKIIINHNKFRRQSIILHYPEISNRDVKIIELDPPNTFTFFYIDLSDFKEKGKAMDIIEECVKNKKSNDQFIVFVSNAETPLYLNSLNDSTTIDDFMNKIYMMQHVRTPDVSFEIEYIKEVISLDDIEGFNKKFSLILSKQTYSMFFDKYRKQLIEYFSGSEPYQCDVILEFSEKESIHEKINFINITSYEPKK